MINTPLGETSTVEELHKYTQCGPRCPGCGGIPHGGPCESTTQGDGWFDTTQFPVFIRVITRPAVIRTGPNPEGDMVSEVIAEAETTTYVLESEDIEIADNALWLIVGAPPEEE